MKKKKISKWWSLASNWPKAKIKKRYLLAQAKRGYWTTVDTRGNSKENISLLSIPVQRDKQNISHILVRIYRRIFALNMQAKNYSVMPWPHTNWLETNENICNTTISFMVISIELRSYQAFYYPLSRTVFIIYKLGHASVAAENSSRRCLVV